MEFGSWSYGGLYIRPFKFDGIGFSVGGSETAGESFAEYSLADEDPVTCREQVYPPFPGAPEEDWPVLLFDVKFHRSWEPYARGYIVMQVILNFARFSAFWLPVQCGERMGLSITSLLKAVASELVVSSNLPSSSEMTWFQSFSLFSLAFGAIALFESAVVIYFFYFTGSDLKPRWWNWIRRSASPIVDLYKRRRATKRNKDTNEDTPPIQDDCIHENGEDTSYVHDFMPENGIAVGVAADSAAVEPPRHDRIAFRNDETAPYTSAEEVASTSIHRQRQRSNSMARDADDFIDNLEAENNKQWKKVAYNIDEVFRVVIPPLYLIILVVFLKAVDKN